MNFVRLSPRQEAACYLVMQGETDHAIARQLDCSVRTVRFHIEEAARRIARERGWTYNLPRNIIRRYHAEHTVCVIPPRAA